MEKKWIDPRRVERNRRIWATVGLAMFVGFLTLLFVLGVMVGRVERDCKWAEQKGYEVVPEFCSPWATPSGDM